MAKCMGVSPVSFKSGVINRENPQDKLKAAYEKRRIAKQEARREKLEAKKAKGELTPAEKAELAGIYFETAAEKLAEFDPRIYADAGQKINYVA